MSQKFAVIGVGKYGSTIARRLSEKGAEVFVFDNNEHNIEAIKDEVAYAVTIDCTDTKALIQQGIKDIDALPENAKKYIYALEDFIGTKVSSISTSPEREDTILLENPFEV